MVVKKFHKNKFKSRGQNLPIRIILVREKKLIESHYEFLKCSIKQNKLVCIGKVKSTEYSKEYSMKLVYNGLDAPKVYVVEPEIEYHDDIHMFPKDKNLCLYHPETDDFHWNFRTDNVYDTIIPWALEWFVYYELYLITGKWEHPFVSHNAIK